MTKSDPVGLTITYRRLYCQPESSPIVGGIAFLTVSSECRSPVNGVEPDI